MTGVAGVEVEAVGLAVMSELSERDEMVWKNEFELELEPELRVELEGPGTARGLTDGRGRGRCEPVDPDPEPNSSFPNPAISLDLAAAADDDDADDPSSPTPKFKPALDLDNDLYSLYFAAIANEPRTTQEIQRSISVRSPQTTLTSSSPREGNIEKTNQPTHSSPV